MDVRLGDLVGLLLGKTWHIAFPVSFEEVLGSADISLDWCGRFRFAAWVPDLLPEHVPVGVERRGTARIGAYGGRRSWLFD